MSRITLSDVQESNRVLNKVRAVSLVERNAHELEAGESFTGEDFANEFDYKELEVRIIAANIGYVRKDKNGNIFFGVCNVHS